MPPLLASHRTAVWTLDELVEEANRLLPDYLPKESSGRSVDEVNPRLVRHYATLGLLPEPLKDGREVRYQFEHLLHLLVVRRLLAEGFSSGAIKRALEGKTGEELERLLQGGVKIELVPERRETIDEAAASYLERIRARAGLGRPATLFHNVSTLAFRTDSEPQQSPHPFTQNDWTRISILDGLELHVRDDFRLPTDRLGDEQLTQLVKVVLLDLEQRRKGRP